MKNIKEEDIVIENSISPFISVRNTRVGIWWFDKKSITFDYSLSFFGIDNTEIKCEKHDIKKESVGLIQFIKMIADIDGVAVHEFSHSDIVRHKILIEITDRYDKMKADGTIPKSKR